MIDDRVAQVAASVDGVLPWARRQLDALVACESVSWPDPDPGGLARAATIVAALLSVPGSEVGVLDAGPGAPYVFADSGFDPRHPERPTVLLYAHYDVVGAGARDDWRHDPFAATEDDGRVYGRGVADAKGCVLVHAAALRAATPACRVKVLVEGAEETGSVGLPELVAADRDRLAADVYVVLDGANQCDRAALITSLRGCLDLRLTVSTLRDAEHSGMYGGLVPDAGSALARLLASLHREDGSVAVEGLRTGVAGDTAADDVEPPLPLSLLPGTALIGRGSVASRLREQPSIAVTALDAPRPSEATHELIPRAGAVISCRLAPDDDTASAERALREHVEAHAPWGAHVELSVLSRGEPVRVSHSGPALGLMARALESAWGKPPALIGDGASIPVCELLARTFPQAEILVTGLADPHSSCHGPNESIRVADFRSACIAEALFLSSLAS